MTLSSLALLLGVLLPLKPPARVEPQGPAFMGVPLQAKSVGFLVDRSKSMEGFRLQKLKEDLVAAIQSLPDEARFTVVAFATEPVFLPGGETRFVSPPGRKTGSRDSRGSLPPTSSCSPTV